MQSKRRNNITSLSKLREIITLNFTIKTSKLITRLLKSIFNVYSPFPLYIRLLYTMKTNMAQLLVKSWFPWLGNGTKNIFWEPLVMKLELLDIVWCSIRFAISYALMLNFAKHLGMCYLDWDNLVPLRIDNFWHFWRFIFWWSKGSFVRYFGEFLNITLVILDISMACDLSFYAILIAISIVR